MATQQARESEATVSKFTARKLNTEHKCNVPSEQKRIESYGGYVKPVEYEDGEMVAPARFYEDVLDRWKGPGLAIARSIGDLRAVQCGLLATPEITSYDLVIPSAHDGASDGGPSSSEHDAFLILASDGVWEFFTPQAAIDIVAPFYRGGERAIDACKTLIKMAAHRAPPAGPSTPRPLDPRPLSTPRPSDLMSLPTVDPEVAASLNPSPQSGDGTRATIGTTSQRSSSSCLQSSRRSRRGSRSSESSARCPIPM